MYANERGVDVKSQSIIPGMSLLVDQARGKKKKEAMRNELIVSKEIRMKNNDVFGVEVSKKSIAYTTSAFCIGPKPRCIHSWGEARSLLSSDPRKEEAKTQSLESEKAQTAGSGAGVAVTARSSLPG